MLKIPNLQMFCAQNWLFAHPLVLPLLNVVTSFHIFASCLAVSGALEPVVWPRDTRVRNLFINSTIYCSKYLLMFEDIAENEMGSAWLHGVHILVEETESELEK